MLTRRLVRLARTAVLLLLAGGLTLTIPAETVARAKPAAAAKAGKAAKDKAAKDKAGKDKASKAKAGKDKASKAKAGKTKSKAKVAKSKARARAKAGVVADLTKDGKPNVQSRQGIVVDLDTDEVLWARQADAVRPIASVSKLMATIVVVEKGLDLAGGQTMSPVDEKVARGGAPSRLKSGYKLTNKDLLHAALLGSDNRAVSALGRSVGLDAKALARAMTAKAAEMELKHTRFGDPTGLDEHNVSTPREVVSILRYAMKDATLGPIIKTGEHDARFTFGKGAKARAGDIHYLNTNRLIKGSRHKILGGKTGYTDEAKYCLAVAGELDHGRKVAMVFLNGEGELTRFGDFKRVAGWLKERPPTLLMAPPSEIEVTDLGGLVPFREAPSTVPVAEEAPVGEGDAVAPEPEPEGPRRRGGHGDPEDLPRGSKGH